MAVKYGLQQVALGSFFAWMDYPDPPTLPDGTAARPLPHLNIGRDDIESWGAPEGDLPGPMSSGYDPSKGAIVLYPLEVLKAHGIDNPEEFAIQQRASLVAWLRANGNVKVTYLRSKERKSATEEDETIEDTFTLSEVADLIESSKVKPRWLATSGQRRTWASWFAALLAHKRGYLADPHGYTVLADVREPKDADALVREQLDENSGEGKRGYSASGYLRAAARVMSAKPLIGETELGQRIGLADHVDARTGKVTTNRRNERQKFYRWARIALRLPRLNLLERVKMAPRVTGEGTNRVVHYDAGGYVPAEKLHKEAAQTFLGEKKNDPEPNAGASIVNVTGKPYVKGFQATPDVVEDYVRGLIVGGRLKSAALTAPDLRKLLDNAEVYNKPVTIGRMVRAILQGNADWFGDVASGEAANAAEPWNADIEGPIGQMGATANGSAEE